VVCTWSVVSSPVPGDAEVPGDAAEGSCIDRPLVKSRRENHLRERDSRDSEWKRLERQCPVSGDSASE
jgi:hypothetical protein